MTRVFFYNFHARTHLKQETVLRVYDFLEVEKTWHAKGFYNDKNYDIFFERVKMFF